MKLLFCAGAERRDGWLTHDGRPESGADILGVVPPLPAALQAIDWTEIEWIHGVGSFDPWVGRDLLIALRDILVAGGKLTLEQPDARAAARMMLNDDRLVWCMFGDPSHRDAAMMNRWAYTPKELRGILLELGFRRVEILPARYHNGSRDFRLEAIK